MRQPVRWTRSPRRWSTPTCCGSPVAGPCLSCPTVCHPWSTATRSWSSNEARSWISDRIQCCSSGVRSTARSGTSNTVTCRMKAQVMQLLPRPSSRAISTTAEDRHDPTLPVILEYQSPSTAIIDMPMPRIASGFTWTFASMIAVLCTLAGVIEVDRVVTATGVVVARSPTIVVQPLETAIVRSIEVHPGDVVHAGQVLARLDPTFATSDTDASAAQVSTLQAQVSRMQAEMENRPFTYSGMDPNLMFQAAVYAQRQSEYNYKIENYQQKFDS